MPRRYKHPTGSISVGFRVNLATSVLLSAVCRQQRVSRSCVCQIALHEYLKRFPFFDVPQVDGNKTPSRIRLSRVDKVKR